MRQQPVIDAAIEADVAALDPHRLPILSVGTRCAAILGRWFPSFEGYDVALTGPLSQTCRHGVVDLNAKAILIQAKALSDRYEPAPETLAGLEANEWFEARPADVRAISDAGDPDRSELERALAARTAAMIQPKRDAALRSTLANLASGFGRTDPSDAELRPVRKVCGPYVGRAGRELPPGGSEIRQAVGAACQAGEKAVGLRRAKSALAAAHVEDVLGDAQLGLTAPDGRVSFADPRRIVVAAAGNGLQVTFQRTGWLFWSRTQMRITSLGGDTASLVGRLDLETRADGVRVWRIVELPSLPGLDGPAATMACLTQGQGAADTVLALGFAAALSFYFDAPLTGIAMIGGAAETAAVADRCAAARQSTFAGPYAAAQ